MVSLLLTDSDPLSPTFGLTLRAGDGIANLAPDGPLFTPGQITELPGEFLALSFFDVSFELSGGPLGATVLHNEPGCRMEATIDRVPPVTLPPTQYVGCTNNVPVLLFDQTGAQRGFVISATHDPIVPEPGTVILLTSGLLLLCGVRWKRR